MNKKLFAFLALAVLFMISCRNNSDNANSNGDAPQAAPTTATSEASGPNLAPQQFADKLAASEGAQVIDVRTTGEFANGHLANAQNINIDGDAFETEINKLDKTKPVFIYCLSGARSTSALETFQKNGFSNVYHLDGGLLAWRAAGLSMDVAAKKPATEAVPATAKEALTGLSKAAFDELLNTDKYVLVDFNAEWCGPCKVLSPILDKIAAEKQDKMKLIKIDVDQNEQLSTEFGISSIPLLHLYKNKQLVWKQVGLVSKAEIESHIK